MSFLSSLLPTIVGGAAVAIAGPAALPWVAGGMGLLETKRTGSLEKGLLAGLGAYGGGQLGGALAQQGMEQAALQAAAEQAGVSAGGTAGALAPSSEFIANGVVDTTKLANYGDALTKAGYGGSAPTGLAGLEAAGRGISSLGTSGGLSQLGQNLANPAIGGSALKTGLMAAAPALLNQEQGEVPTTPTDKSLGQRYSYNPGTTTPTPAPDVPDYGNLGQDFGRPRRYFTPSYNRITDEEAKNLYGFAFGGPVEAMSNANSVGQNTGFPQSGIRHGAYATPWQTPIPRNMLEGAADTGVNPISGEMNFARGGLSDLGDYSDGGRLLRGPGDGVSDSIPAVIGQKQPARLADGEFVVPARIVSELGNGSTEAGARKLYAMMDRVQKARAKTVGKGKVAKRNNADKLLPA